MKTYIYIMISRWILLRNRKFSDEVVEKIKIHILVSTPFFTENVDVYETIRKNMANPDRSICQYNTGQKTWVFSCRITKAEIQAHTQNTQYLLHFQGKGNYTEVPQCPFTRPSPVVFRVDKVSPLFVLYPKFTLHWTNVYYLIWRRFSVAYSTNWGTVPWLTKDMEPTLKQIGRKFYSNDVDRVTDVSLHVAWDIIKLKVCSKIGIKS
jgi:hypothetical protein